MHVLQHVFYNLSTLHTPENCMMLFKLIPLHLLIQFHNCWSSFCRLFANCMWYPATTSLHEMDCFNTTVNTVPLWQAFLSVGQGKKIPRLFQCFGLRSGCWCMLLLRNIWNHRSIWNFFYFCPNKYVHVVQRNSLLLKYGWWYFKLLLLFTDPMKTP